MRSSRAHRQNGTQVRAMANCSMIIQDSGGDEEKSRKIYEDGMTKAFRRSLDALKHDGRMVVVFANKEVDAWQSLIGALIRSGAVVTASWPIQTEMVNKSHPEEGQPFDLGLDRMPESATRALCPDREDDVLAKMRSILLDPREGTGGQRTACCISLT